jgi:hypothetical protein
VNWYDAPFVKDSDVNATTDSGSEAILCGAPSWFIQVTVVPVFIVSIAGLNAKFLIAIEFNPVAGIGIVGVDVARLWLEAQPENEQVRISRIAHADEKITREQEIIVSHNAVRNEKCSCRNNLGISMLLFL